MAILKFSDLPLGNVKLADTQFVGLQPEASGTTGDKNVLFNASDLVDGYATLNYVDDSVANLKTYVDTEITNLDAQLTANIALVEGNIINYVDQEITNVELLIGNINANVSSLGLNDLTDVQADPILTPGPDVIAGVPLVFDATSNLWVAGKILSAWQDKGYTGSRGDTGFTGSQGIQGNVGLTGSQGELGFTGSQGTQGYTGSEGAQGNMGYTGSRGDQGEQGPWGYTGSKGEQGAQGQSVKIVGGLNDIFRDFVPV